MGRHSIGNRAFIAGFSFMVGLIFLTSFEGCFRIGGLVMMAGGVLFGVLVFARRR